MSLARGRHAGHSRCWPWPRRCFATRRRPSLPHRRPQVFRPEAARHTANSDQLLDAYAAAATTMAPATSLTVGVTWRDMVSGLTDTGRRWEKAGVAWSATGAVAASVIAPYLSSVNVVEVYVGAKTIAGLEAVAAEAELRPIAGGRLTLRPFPTVTARRLASEMAGVHVAPWPRVYVDLRTFGVRGEEAAEHLLEVIRGR